MEVNELITKFQNFIEANYLKQLHTNIREGKLFLSIDFQDICKFDLEISEELLEKPEETLKAFELGLKNFDLGEEVGVIPVRINNLPQEQNILIRNIRSEHLGKFFWTTGTVRQKSDVRPQVTTARFECPSCGNIIPVLQLDKKFKEPSRCGCGRKGKFRLLSKELVDAQGIVLEEATKDLEGGEQPKRMNVFLTKDLVSPLSEKNTNPGNLIRVAGIIKEVPIILRTGGQSTKFDLLIEANHVESVEEDYSTIQISQEDQEQLEILSKDPKIYEKLRNSLAPGIYGHDLIKEALCLQFVGGVSKMRDDGVRTRGDIHMLLVGDPGAGKSQLLKRSSVVAPKARYVSGKGVSGAGLTAAVVKDEFLSGWSLEAGALVLANKGIVIIDELDKMSPEDRSAMHEALEQQTVSISKANIQATLRCETTVLAAANPKFGRFDPYEVIAKQIDLPPALINRFDLIFTIRDLPDETKDAKMAQFILSLHKIRGTEEVDLPTDLLRKYLVYAKQIMSPVLTEEAIEELKEYYVKMRNSGGSEEKGMQTIPISARQLEALVRLSEASAKLRLSKKVTRVDAKRAVGLLHYCLEQVGMDPETGKIDIDRISSGVTTSERSKISLVKEIINELEESIGKNIPIDEIVNAAKEKGVEEDKTTEVIEKLKRSGDLFEPRRGEIQKI
ncbi:minichromosome maintenance protein MCM [Candidatus Woesearchaeota archaeon]|jgi:replicative DNA helicase Mcm|nr:minichromosome maintenance protein MCM [Candidatus Woesearchaeota archaeon]MBT6336744.1 minichromosome maintenance protein MCM [Candidatus Woesearchaeota archaeon]MBT7928117.1 minichromosome maintenance protein MCM [Candidatus Woesearchaeota archaeon]